MQVKTNITINAPIQKVFDVFSDVQKIEQRIKGIQKVEILSDVKQGKGLKWKETRLMFGKTATEIMWITSFTQNKSYEVEAQSHGTKYHTVYTFTEVNKNTTEVNMVFSGKPISFGAKVMGLLSFAFVGSVKKALLADMQDLKRVCEG
jgi:uncharacterized membrane protein